MKSSIKNITYFYENQNWEWSVVNSWAFQEEHALQQAEQHKCNLKKN